MLHAACYYRPRVFRSTFPKLMNHRQRQGFEVERESVESSREEGTNEVFDEHFRGFSGKPPQAKVMLRA